MNTPLEMLEISIKTLGDEINAQEDILTEVQQEIQNLKHCRNQYTKVIELLRREALKK